MKNEQVISEINKKVEHYFSLVKKHRDDGNYADAAVNIRHILEVLLKAYTEQYLPEAAFLKTFDQIEALKAANIVSKTSGDTLHGVRMAANKGAHEGENRILGKDISSMMAGLNKEYEILKKYLQENAPKEVAVEIKTAGLKTSKKQQKLEAANKQPASEKSKKQPVPKASKEKTGSETSKKQPASKASKEKPASETSNKQLTPKISEKKTASEILPKQAVSQVSQIPSVPVTPQEKKTSVQVSKPAASKWLSEEKRKNIRISLSVFLMAVICMLIGSVLFREQKNAQANAPQTTEAPEKGNEAEPTILPEGEDALTVTIIPTSEPVITATIAPTMTPTVVSVVPATATPTVTPVMEPTATVTPTEAPKKIASTALEDMQRVKEKGFSFVTTKQIDTIGNEYLGKNIATLTMSGKADGYADFYTGKQYQYLTGMVAPHDSSSKNRTGNIIVYVKEEDGEWYEIFNTKDIHRTVAPFQIIVDISGADWVSIKYTHVDKNTSDYNKTREEASVILSQFAFSEEYPETLEVKQPDFGEVALLSERKISRSVGMEIVTKKMTDTIGNEYIGKNMETMVMTGKTAGYADYYTGGNYRYFSGIIAVEDSSSKKRTGRITIYTKEEGGEWYEVYTTKDIHRTVGPFQIEVDIANAAWVRIQYEHIDKNTSDYNTVREEATVILTQCAFSKESRGNLEIKYPDYGASPMLSDIKITRSVGLEFVNKKQTDVLENEYVGKNVVNLTMTGKTAGYVDYFVGGKYNSLKGEVAVNNTSSKNRIGKITIYTKADGGEWQEVWVKEDISRNTAPFYLEADITNADWISIKYEHTDKKTSDYNTAREEAVVILSGMMLR